MAVARSGSAGRGGGGKIFAVAHYSLAITYG